MKNIRKILANLIMMSLVINIAGCGGCSKTASTTEINTTSASNVVASDEKDTDTSASTEIDVKEEPKDYSLRWNIEDAKVFSNDYFEKDYRILFNRDEAISELQYMCEHGENEGSLDNGLVAEIAQEFFEKGAHEVTKVNVRVGSIVLTPEEYYKAAEFTDLHGNPLEIDPKSENVNAYYNLFEDQKDYWDKLVKKNGADILLTEYKKSKGYTNIYQMYLMTGYNYLTGVETVVGYNTLLDYVFIARNEAIKKVNYQRLKVYAQEHVSDYFSKNEDENITVHVGKGLDLDELFKDLYGMTPEEWRKKGSSASSSSGSQSSGKTGEATDYNAIAYIWDCPFCGYHLEGPNAYYNNESIQHLDSSHTGEKMYCGQQRAMDGQLYNVYRTWLGNGQGEMSYEPVDG